MIAFLGIQNLYLANSIRSRAIPNVKKEFVKSLPKKDKKNCLGSPLKGNVIISNNNVTLSKRTNLF